MSLLKIKESRRLDYIRTSYFLRPVSTCAQNVQPHCVLLGTLFVCRVLLPDGRTQVVEYRVEGKDTGYVASVK